LSQGSGAYGIPVATFGAGAVIGILVAGGRGNRVLAGAALGGMLGGALGPVFVWLTERAETPWQALPCAILGTAAQGLAGGLLVGAIHWFCGGIVENLKERYRAWKRNPP
jgi:hypothetical protein